MIHSLALMITFTIVVETNIPWTFVTKHLELDRIKRRRLIGNEDNVKQQPKRLKPPADTSLQASDKASHNNPSSIEGQKSICSDALYVIRSICILQDILALQNLVISYS